MDELGGVVEEMGITIPESTGLGNQLFGSILTYQESPQE